MLHGLVGELVVPAVKQKDVEVRTAGLLCLGLVSLLDKVGSLRQIFPTFYLNLPVEVLFGVHRR